MLPPQCLIRACRPSDAAALTALAWLSKARWGYPDEWLALWRADLAITPETIEDSIGCVAEIDARIIGFWIRAAIDADEPTRGWLFVHPDYWRRGVARALWSELRKAAAARGIAHFVIEADPNAVPFYRSIGAMEIGRKESTVIPGRFLPILRIPV